MVAGGNLIFHRSARLKLSHCEKVLVVRGSSVCTVTKFSQTSHMFVSENVHNRILAAAIFFHKNKADKINDTVRDVKHKLL